MNKLQYFILILFYLNKIQRFDKKNIEIAINCGSDREFNSFDEFTYLKDKYYNRETKISKWNENISVNKAVIKYTDDRTLFMTERWSDKSFYYKIPLKNEGKYTLVTQHSENAFDSKNQRVMNIKIGNCSVIKNLDVAGELGRFSTKNTYTEFTLKNNNIYFDNKLCKKGYKKSKIRITFEKTKFDNPQVQGIIIVKGGLENTDYYNLKKIKENFDELYDRLNFKEQLKENFQKMYSMRKLKKKIRNDYKEFYEHYDNYIEEEKETIGFNKKIFINIFLIILILGLIYIKFKIKFVYK